MESRDLIAESRLETLRGQYGPGIIPPSEIDLKAQPAFSKEEKALRDVSFFGFS